MNIDLSNLTECPVCHCAWFDDGSGPRDVRCARCRPTPRHSDPVVAAKNAAFDYESAYMIKELGTALHISQEQLHRAHQRIAELELLLKASCS